MLVRSDLTSIQCHEEVVWRLNWLHQLMISHVFLPTELNMLIYVVPLAVGFLIVAVALIFFCKYQAWTMKPMPLPGPLVTFFFF